MALLLRSRAILLVALLCVLFATGCHVQFIMDYDEVVDRGLTQVQQDTEQFLGQIELDAGTPAASYDSTKQFYVKEEAALKTVRTRVQFEPKSTEVLAQIDALSNSLDRLQKLHSTAGPNGLSQTVIELARAPLETEFASIAQLQVALKNRLKSVPSNATAPDLRK